MHRGGVASAVMSQLGRWMDDNLATQGYCLGAEERRRLALLDRERQGRTPRAA
jgi:hypothetical protein